jgi:hypothetical protein
MLEALVLVVTALVMVLLEEIAAEETGLDLALGNLGRFHPGELDLAEPVVVETVGLEEIDSAGLPLEETQPGMELGQRLQALKEAEAELTGEMQLEQ